MEWVSQSMAENEPTENQPQEVNVGSFDLGRADACLTPQCQPWRL